METEPAAHGLNEKRIKSLLLWDGVKSKHNKNALFDTGENMIFKCDLQFVTLTLYFFTLIKITVFIYDTLELILSAAYSSETRSITNVFLVCAFYFEKLLYIAHRRYSSQSNRAYKFVVART